MKTDIGYYFIECIIAISLIVPLAINQTVHAQDETNPFIQHHDQDGDGQISIDEFIATVEERFNQLDQDGNGYIDEAETPKPRPGRKMMGMGPGFLERFDEDQDGRISENEFPGNEDDFSRLDKNQDGYIDHNDLPEPGMGQGMMGDRFFKPFDADID